jgi:hypothetical protein
MNRTCAALALSLMCAGVVGCSSEDPPSEHGPVRPPDGDYIFPQTGYTGFNGNNTFRLPLVTNLKNVTWTIEDPSILYIDATNAPDRYKDFGESWAMATTLAAGTTKVTATDGTKTVSCTIVVLPYTVEQIAIGAKRYYNPDNGDAADRPSCASCHEALQGADHSPLELEFFDDADVTEAITDGKYPDGYVLKNVDHRWNLTPDELTAMAPYLRTLAPRGFF